MAFWNKISQAMGNTQSNTSSTSSEAAAKSIHEPFSSMMGLGSSTTFTENAIILGNATYPYSQIQSIKFISKPSSSLFQGVAQAVTDSGKVLTLPFAFTDTERFLNALNFADEKINEAHGTTKNCKYILQSVEGSKLEIYDDYAQLYYLPTGAKNLVSNSIQSGGVTTTLFFDKIEIQVVGINAKNNLEVSVKYDNESRSLYLNSADEQTVRAAIDYITNSVSANSSTMTTSQLLQTDMTAAAGSAKRFTLGSQVLDIPENEDVFNTYRLKFRELTCECTDCARTEFNKRVRDLTSYLEFFPYIYNHYMNVMADKAIQAAIGEGVWSVTAESFIQKHAVNFRLAMDDLAVTVESVGLTIQNNQSSTANFMSCIPNLVGGGFGLKGAAKGIAAATAFNVARNSVESSLIKSASCIKQTQQVELYNRINRDALFEHVFFDYWRTFLTLVDVLNANGKDIWFPNDQAAQQANNIFNNLSNPAFPQAQIENALVGILQACPYNIEYHKFMVSHFGKTAETTAISNYFGYIDFNDPRIC